MSSSVELIRIPWSVRWHHFRSRIFPVVTLVAALCVTGWLWQRRAMVGNATGAVEVVKTTIASDLDGMLTGLPGSQVEVFQRVTQGKIVARLDDTLFKRQRAALQLELDRLTADLRAATSKPDTIPAQAQSMRDAISTKEEEIAGIDLKLQALVIRSPVTGTVTILHRRPGQIVRIGEPVLEVTSDESAHIVSFIREDQNLHVVPGMQVLIHPASTPGRSFVSQVDEVAGNIESVPNRQLRDQKVQEWGQPVKVAAPPEANLKPGEIVNLTFKPGTGSGSSGRGTSVQ